MGITPETLNTVATAIQAVEGAASTAAQTVGAAPTNAQKLQAAVGFISAVDPTVAAWATPAETLVSALVGIYNLFGIFKHK